MLMVTVLICEINNSSSSETIRLKFQIYSFVESQFRPFVEEPLARPYLTSRFNLLVKL